jgi:hypothetical protein
VLALELQSFDGPEALKLVEFPDPERERPVFAGPGVLIEVHAAGVVRRRAGHEGAVSAASGAPVRSRIRGCRDRARGTAERRASARRPRGTNTEVVGAAWTEYMRERPSVASEIGEAVNRMVEAGFCTADRRSALPARARRRCLAARRRAWRAGQDRPGRPQPVVRRRPAPQRFMESHRRPRWTWHRALPGRGEGAPMAQSLRCSGGTPAVSSVSHEAGSASPVFRG